jgi:hypothetical protein
MISKKLRREGQIPESTIDSLSLVREGFPRAKHAKGMLQ